MKLYLSGPINGISDFRQRFSSKAFHLRKHGFEVVDPCDVDACSDLSCWDRPRPGTNWNPGSRYGAPDHTWECFMRYDIEAMVHCDGLAMLDGWMNSSGATVEFQIARSLGIPCKTTPMWTTYAKENF